MLTPHARHGGAHAAAIPAQDHRSARTGKSCCSLSAAMMSARSTAPIASPSTWACDSICTATWCPTPACLRSCRNLDETGKPLFDLRGIQPFHDFPEGPDWWNRDDYKAILGQLPKLGMNFFGLHTYPEGTASGRSRCLDRPGARTSDAQGEVAVQLSRRLHYRTAVGWGIKPMQDQRVRVRCRPAVRPRRLRRRCYCAACMPWPR